MSATTEVGKRAAHRPRLLSPETHKALIDTLKIGLPINLVCQHVGIAESTFYRWTQRGYAEHEARAALEADPDCGLEPDPEEEPFLDLYRDMLTARASAAVRNMGYIQKVAQGGLVTEEVTRRYRNEDGEMVSETVVKRSIPDWRAAAWYLERSHRGEFAKGAEQVELSGPGGAPIQVAGENGKLAAQLTAFLATAAADSVDTDLPEPGRLLESGHGTDPEDDGIVDAEVIEDA